MIPHVARRGLFFLVTFLLCLPSTGRAGEALPADLAFVPADALGFVHVRLADVWRSPHFKMWRETVLQAGEPALAAFDQRFIPAPSSVDCLTVVVAAPGPGDRDPQVLAILRTSRAIDREAFIKHTLPGAKEEQINGKTHHFDLRGKIGVTFLDDRTLVFGPAGVVRAALAKSPVRQGALSKALVLANSGKALVAGVNTAAVAPLLLQHVPPQFQALGKAKLATLTVDLAGRGHVALRLGYATPGEAREAEEAAAAGIKMARALLAKAHEELRKKVLGDGKPGKLEELPEAAGALMGLGGLKRVDEFLAKPPLTRENSSLLVALELPQGGPETVAIGAMATGLLLPAVQKVREAAARTQDANNLKQLAIAMHNYAAAAGKGFPPAAICDAAGKPLLSWRVALLPYLEANDLYKQFNLNESWDSPHNRRLSALMPAVYATPAALPTLGETHYRVFVGNGAVLDQDRSTRLAQITDGTSNTLLIVETADSVPWTKPDGIAYDPKGPLPRFASFYGGAFLAAFADGSVRTLRADLPEATLRALITRAGGEPVNPDQ